MLSKIYNPAATLAQCWYLRRHVPDGRRWREDDGALHCTCRYCQRPIRSRDGGRWDLSDGLDLDALAASAPTAHFAVVDRLDDMVIARYPVAAQTSEDDLKSMLAEILAKHGVEDADGAIQVHLVQGRQPLH